MGGNSLGKGIPRQKERGGGVCCCGERTVAAKGIIFHHTAGREHLEEGGETGRDL